MSSAEGRPAVSLSQRAEHERRLVRAVQEAEWRRRMASAGSIDLDTLSEQGRRILAWLAEWDDWTVDGVIELLTAAHRAGKAAAEPAPTGRRGVEDTTPADRLKARRAALRGQRPQPEVGL